MTRYTGGCQCGAVRYEADISLDQPITCNCSRCQPLGAVWAYGPRGAFTLISGEDALTEFRFNKGAVTHLFCKTCGIQGFAFRTTADGADMVVVNINTIDGVDPRDFASRAHHFNGRDL